MGLKSVLYRYMFHVCVSLHVFHVCVSCLCFMFVRKLCFSAAAILTQVFFLQQLP